MSPPPIQIGSTFEFATAGRILFGAGKVKELEAAAAALGERPLLVTGSRGGPKAFVCQFPLWANQPSIWSAAEQTLRAGAAAT
jgi:hypothetical protein